MAESSCTGYLVSYEAGSVFEHPGDVHDCPVCGPTAAGFDREDAMPRLAAAIERVEGWVRPYAYAAPETLGTSLRAALALWAALLVVLRAALIEHTDVMSLIEKPYWDASLALADAILGEQS